MTRYLELVKKGIKSHTLLTDIFGYTLTLTGFADKYLAGQVTMYKSYSWLKRRFKNYIGKEEYSIPQKVDNGKVWICWLQGIDSAPDIVRECYQSIKQMMPEKEIVVITRENMSKYVQFPDYIVNKWNKGIITNTHLSDILRLELLIRYGGTWMDATTFMTGDIPRYIEESELFVYRNGWMDMEMINMASWFISVKHTNNILLSETLNLLYKYWEQYDYMKNYFIFHMFFRMVTDVYHEQWDKVPYINHMDSHLLIEELTGANRDEDIAHIKEITPIHKLTYKVEPSKIESVELQLKKLDRGETDECC